MGGGGGDGGDWALREVMHEYIYPIEPTNPMSE